MAKLPMPDLPDGDLKVLIGELHSLHARAGWPSVRTIAKGKPFSYNTVHEILTANRTERPNLPALLSIVESLAAMDPRADPERLLDKFDQLWQAARRAEEPTADRLHLSYRDEEVIRLILSGMNDRQMAAALMISISTVRSYTDRIRRKLRVNSRAELVTRLQELNLDDDDPLRR